MLGSTSPIRLSSIPVPSPPSVESGIHLLSSECQSVRSRHLLDWRLRHLWPPVVLFWHNPRTCVSSLLPVVHSAPQSLSQECEDCVRHLHVCWWKVSQLESESELCLRLFRVGTHTSPIVLPCSSMWTVKMIVDIPISNQRSLENICKALCRCFSARLGKTSVGICIAYVHSRDRKNRHTIVELVQDFLQPCVSPQPSQFQPLLQQTSSPRPIWLLHCVVESIMDLCCPILPPRVVFWVPLQQQPSESPKPNQLPWPSCSDWTG